MNNRYNTLRNSASRYSTTTVMDGAARQVLRNTYLLLSLCLGFSAITAGVTAALRLPGPGILITIAGYFGLLYLVTKNRDRGLGVAMVFALTGFMGYTLGPIISHYLKMPNGTMTVMMALGGTAAIFLGMSAYALFTKRDLSFMRGMLTVGILVAFVAALAGIFLQIPALSLTVSAVFVLLMSGMILYETNNIVRGGETNYVMATVSLFVSIFNLFTSLLQLLGFANKE
ncbi:Bax inhibitor-1/YccA family protein [Glaciimonas sp. Gout2]|uniref:Bax inhibitor-1/YccA family protein n=1 Tax=unclassified Glaciimonas TaxID=2644401 RepID=UPI002B232142|nr:MULTISPECIES: Bax inhibitor-1/YccA family protein [unclassified Glaciimonas]MEB0010852.1 Bax inhibitor-1/YccA family protein [Glaciimonas sp. Cout2]MEB0081633.1 Bax inhibitor-1/YccA family protein [Glaciimonas sp. Gout2]